MMLNSVPISIPVAKPRYLHIHTHPTTKIDSHLISSSLCSNPCPYSAR